MRARAEPRAQREIRDRRRHGRGAREGGGFRRHRHATPSGGVRARGRRRHHRRPHAPRACIPGRADAWRSPPPVRGDNPNSAVRGSTPMNIPVDIEEEAALRPRKSLAFAFAVVGFVAVGAAVALAATTHVASKRREGRAVAPISATQVAAAATTTTTTTAATATSAPSVLAPSVTASVAEAPHAPVFTGHSNRRTPVASASASASAAPPSVFAPPPQNSAFNPEAMRGASRSSSRRFSSRCSRADRRRRKKVSPARDSTKPAIPSSPSSTSLPSRSSARPPSSTKSPTRASTRALRARARSHRRGVRRARARGERGSRPCVLRSSLREHAERGEG